MPYTKYNDPWVDADAATGGGDESTPIVAAALDHIESGISAAAATADAAIPAPGSPSTNDGLFWDGNDWVADTIDNAKVASNAAIAVSKLASGSASDVLATSGGAAAWASLLTVLAAVSVTASFAPTKITQDASDATNVAHTDTIGVKMTVGKFQIVKYSTGFTAAGTASQPITVQGLPTSAYTGMVAGGALYNDFGTAFYALIPTFTTTTSLRFWRPDGSGTPTTFGGSTTIASSDTLDFFVIYLV
jgi:hypothetical protein